MGEGGQRAHSIHGDFEEWFRLEYPQVQGSLILAIGDSDIAEDSAAEAFARAYERWDRVRAMERPMGWVYTVALNLARRKLRRRAVERRLLLKFHQRNELPLPPESGFELWDLVRTLPPRERTAVVLRYGADLREADVAKAMGISAGTVAKTLNVARSRLGLALETSPNPKERSD
jgi:RNA polymerase sigma-70 factor, ECF subfamily